MTKKPRKESYRVTITRPDHVTVENIRVTIRQALNGYGQDPKVELIRKTKEQSGFWSFMTKWLAPDAQR